ncbi:MAG: response regulator transcription factor [Candidatus Sericytochromatia bacterium]
MRILAVDDDEAMLAVLTEWFALFSCVIDTAPDGMQALAKAKATPYDVVITDLHMPAFDGHQLLAWIKEIQPETQVIILSGSGSMEDAIEALRQGRGFDYLQKPLRDFDKLNEVIRRAVAVNARASAPVAIPAEVEPLTQREREIVALIADGLDNAGIADRLCLSEKTVKNHLTRIYERLKVHNRTQAVLACQQYGFI